MPNFERLPTWVSQFEMAREIKEYDELINNFNSLRIKVEEKQEITPEEHKEFSRIINAQWKRIIADKCTEIKYKIQNRKTKGQSFSHNLRELEKIRCEGEKDLPVDVYHDLYKFNLLDIEKDVDEKIQNEKYIEEINKSNKDYIDKISKESRNKGRIDAIIVGIFLLIVTIILHYFGIT